jgi:hypothetical protein
MLSSKKILIIFMLFSFIIAMYCVYAKAETLEAYPNINIFGYKKYIYDSINLSDAVTPEPYFTGNYYSHSWNEELNLTVNGILNKDLSLFYNLEQYPKRPDVFNVGITYYQNRLVFGLLNDLYYSDHFLPANVSGIVASTNLFGVTPFIISSTTMNNSIYDSDNNGLIVPLDYEYKDPLYYGSKLFPVHGNYEDQSEKEYWIKERDLIHGYSLFDRPDAYMNLTPQSNRLFLIHETIQANSEMIYVDGQRRFKDLDYGLNYSRGELVFFDNLPEISDVHADYSVLNIDNKNDVSGGGLSWKPNKDIEMAMGYISSVPKTDWNQDFTVSNLSARYTINENNKLWFDVNSSDYGKGASKESVGAYSITYDYRVGKFNMHFKEDYNGYGYTYPSLVMFGEKTKRSQSSCLLEYDISGGHITNGVLRIGSINIEQTTFEAAPFYSTDAYFAEANNTFDEWLEMSNRCQTINTAYKVTSMPDPDVTDSLLNVAAINVDKIFPALSCPSKIYIKDLQESYRYAYIPYEGMNRNELGTLNTFGPFTLLLSRSIQNTTDASITSEVSSQYRLTYEYAPFNVNIIFGYSDMDGSFGSMIYDDIKRELSFVFDVPRDPIFNLLRVNYGFGFRTISHRDSRGSDYSYDANQMHFNGTLYF